MKLSDLMVDTKSAWVEFPGFSGFEVEVANLSRPEFIALRKKCVITKFDKKTRQPMEELNEEKFVAEFTKATIKNWKGLKLKYLEQILLIDTANASPDAELPYDQDNARELVKNSTEFDQWINEVVFDLDNFRSFSTGRNVEETGEVAG